MNRGTTEEAERPLKNRHPIIPKIIIFSDKIKIGIVEGCNKRGVSHIVELPFLIIGPEAKHEKYNDTTSRVH